VDETRGGLWRQIVQKPGRQLDSMIEPLWVERTGVETVPTVRSRSEGRVGGPTGEPFLPGTKRESAEKFRTCLKEASTAAGDSRSQLPRMRTLSGAPGHQVEHEVGNAKQDSVIEVA